MKVSQVMTTNVTSVGPKTSLTEASKLMRDLNVGALPVVKGKSLQGIVTDRDIATRAGAKHWDFDKKTVAEVMSKDVACCKDGDTVDSAVKLMESRQIRRLPVQNAAGEMVGILSLGDVALRESHELSGEALHAISEHGAMAPAQ
jgi:CBS-domain-containing membrane protein